LNRIIASLEFSPEKAELVFNRNRYILIRPETVVEFQKMVEGAVGTQASDLMFKAAFKIGSQIGKSYGETSGLSQRQMISSMLETANDLGWAKLFLTESGEFPKVVVLEATNSAFASAYGRSPTPVCHLIRGILAGAFSQMIGPFGESQETECLAAGHGKCVFEFRLGLISDSSDE
jgi:predicted hydrocarbon binding protein